MFIARWQIDARFGQKPLVVELMRKWEREIGPQVGLPEMVFALLTGSIGAREATVEANHKVAMTVAEGDRLAFTEACAYPDGTQVYCMAAVELEGGRIARQTVVQAWDE